MVLTFDDYFKSPSFEAVCASLPGGPAYDKVKGFLEKLPHLGQMSSVWFNNQPVWGVSADEGRWEHPFGECGRHEQPYPGPVAAKWRGKVESRQGEWEPEENRCYPCWCCAWLRLVNSFHKRGEQIICSTSNILHPAWVQLYGASSSEVPDECFRLTKPARWGVGTLDLDLFGVKRVPREAGKHSRTGLPLGAGCRWERQALDALPYEVSCHFLPPCTVRCFIIRNGEDGPNATEVAEMQRLPGSCGACGTGCVVS